MKRIEYRWVNKSQWDRGPWDQEPDKVQWQNKRTGLPCLALRHETHGNWCGYVGVADGHPCFGRDYTDLDIQINCHGGLTFSGFCREHDKEHGICHVPAPGEPDRVWWFGFDCCHAFDLAPGLEATLKKIGVYKERFHYHDVYRNLRYVQRECADLAQQLQKKSGEL